jgi:hypothetical protein
MRQYITTISTFIFFTDLLMAYASSIGAVAANLISSFLQDSSDEDDEMVHAGIMQELEGLMSRPTKANRIKFYVETVIPGYSNIEFRQHFRMNFATYESLEGRILANGSLVNTSGTGRHRISHRKQLLAVIWLLATPDSFR